MVLCDNPEPGVTSKELSIVKKVGKESQDAPQQHRRDYKYTGNKNQCVEAL